MRLEYFQMLDTVEALDTEAASIVMRSRVPETSPVFEGHFPDHPLLPGVLLLETMAQASGYLLLAIGGFGRMPFFARAKDANFRNFVRPGDSLSITATRIHDGSGFAVTRAQIARASERVCDGELLFRLVPFPAPGLEAHVRNEGVRLGFLPEAD